MLLPRRRPECRGNSLGTAYSVPPARNRRSRCSGAAIRSVLSMGERIGGVPPNPARPPRLPTSLVDGIRYALSDQGVDLRRNPNVHLRQEARHRVRSAKDRPHRGGSERHHDHEHHHTHEEFVGGEKLLHRTKPPRSRRRSQGIGEREHRQQRRRYEQLSTDRGATGGTARDGGPGSRGSRAATGRTGSPQRPRMSDVALQSAS